MYPNVQHIHIAMSYREPLLLLTLQYVLIIIFVMFCIQSMVISDMYCSSNLIIVISSIFYIHTVYDFNSKYLIDYLAINTNGFSVS